MDVVQENLKEEPLPQKSMLVVDAEVGSPGEYRTGAVPTVALVVEVGGAGVGATSVYKAGDNEGKHARN